MYDVAVPWQLRGADIADLYEALYMGGCDRTPRRAQTHPATALWMKAAIGAQKTRWEPLRHGDGPDRGRIVIHRGEWHNPQTADWFVLADNPWLDPNEVVFLDRDGLVCARVYDFDAD